MLTAKQTAAIATMALIGIGYSLAAIVVLHFLRPDYDPTRNFISDYATGSYGILMTSGFFGLGLGSLALVIGLYQDLSQAGRSWAGLLLLGLWAVGIVVVAIFPGDVEGAPETSSGGIHNFASLLAFIGLVSGAFVLSRRFRKDERWEQFYPTALIGSLVILLTFIVFFVTVFTQDSEVGGLIQRIFLAAVFTWLLSTAARLRSTATGSGSR